MDKDDLERYDILEKNLMSFGTKFKYEYAKKHLKKGKILDIGCGLVNSSDYFEDVIAIENDQEAIKVLKERYPELEVVHANALSLPFENGFFDSCLLIEIIEHVNDPTALLKEVHRVLKPKGRCIITTPNRSVTEIFSKLKIIKPKIASHHFKEYIPEELKEIVKMSGFNIIKTTGITQVRYSLTDLFLFKNKMFSDIVLNMGRIFPFLSSNIILICEKIL